MRNMRSVAYNDLNNMEHPMRIRRQTLAITSGIALMFAAQGASADIVASLVFTNPTGIVGPNDNVAPWMRFSLDPTSDPLDLTDLTSFGWSGMATVTSAYVNVGFGCSDTFTGGCDGNGHPYRYDWNYSATEGYQVVQRPDLKMAPGDSLDFSMVTFFPNGAPVPAGTYVLPRMQVALHLQGTQTVFVFDDAGNVVFDADGNPVTELKETAYDQYWVTCSNFSGAGCSPPQIFERTVIAVPEAETYATMLAGLGLLGFLARRRKS